MDRPERVQAKLLGQPVGVNRIALVRGLASSSHIADHHTLGVRLQQVVQPLRMRASSKATWTGEPMPFTRPTIALASVGTVARMRIAPPASLTVATLVAWCTSNARY